MKVQISKIKITNRIRKEIAKIAELSADIQTNGLTARHIKLYSESAAVTRRIRREKRTCAVYPYPR